MCLGTARMVGSRRRHITGFVSLVRNSKGTGTFLYRNEILTADMLCTQVKAWEMPT